MSLVAASKIRLVSRNYRQKLGCTANGMSNENYGIVRGRQDQSVGLIHHLTKFS